MGRKQDYSGHGNADKDDEQGRQLFHRNTDEHEGSAPDGGEDDKKRPGLGVGGGRGFGHGARLCGGAISCHPKNGMVVRVARKGTSSALPLRLPRHALVEIVGADFCQVFNLVLEEVVGIGDHLVFDGDAFLGFQF